MEKEALYTSIDCLKESWDEWLALLTDIQKGSSSGSHNIQKLYNELHSLHFLGKHQDT